MSSPEGGDRDGSGAAPDWPDQRAPTEMDLAGAGAERSDLPPTQLPCPNCGDPTEGNYCRSCGQRKTTHRASVRVLLAEALEDHLSLTSELPRTLRALITRPGFLTREYTAGRIARYIPPLRLYLVASLLFFVLFSFRTHEGALTTPEEVAGTTAENAAPLDTTSLSEDSVMARERARGHLQIDIRTPSKWLNAKIKAKNAEMAKMPPGEAQVQLQRFLVKHAPTMVFLLLPLFALILHIFYWRSRRYYTEHFVFALHVHAFAFLVMSVVVALPPVRAYAWPRLALFTWIVLYTGIALWNVYGQRWFITLIKYSMIATAYFILFILGMVSFVIIGMFTI